jgi:hypothetical protein
LTVARSQITQTAKDAKAALATIDAAYRKAVAAKKL